MEENNKGSQRLTGNKPLVPKGRFAPNIPTTRRRRTAATSQQGKETENVNNSEGKQVTEYAENTKMVLDESSSNKQAVKEQPIKEEPKAVKNIVSSVATDNKLAEQDSSDEEFGVYPTQKDDIALGGMRYSTHASSGILPIALPFNLPSEQKLDTTKQPGSINHVGVSWSTENWQKDIKTDSIAAKMFQNNCLFIQLPPILPIDASSVQQNESIPARENEETVDEKASREVKMQELKYILNRDTQVLEPDLRHLESQVLGRLQIFRSGKVQIVIHGIPYQVLEGAECGFVQNAVQVDWENSTMAELGAVDNRFICVPEIL